MPFFNVVVVGFILFLMFIVSIIKVIISFVMDKNINLVPIFITFLTFVIIAFAPLNEIYLSLDYIAYYNKRKEVIDVIYNQNLGQFNGNSYVYELPKKYKSLSYEGEIVIENNYKNKIILFYTYRGIMDNFSGFIYIPNGYILHNEIFNSEIIQKVKINNNWYWVACS